MKELLSYFLDHIVLAPDKLAVEEKEEDGQLTFYVSCAPEDMGRIIGKKGKVIKALRRILSIVAVREGKRVSITMVNE